MRYGEIEPPLLGWRTRLRAPAPQQRATVRRSAEWRRSMSTSLARAMHSRLRCES